MNSKFSADFLVFIKIYEYNLKNEPIWFSKLRHVMEGEVENVSKYLDYLFDIGMIEAHWDQFEGKWTRCFKVTDEMEPLAKVLYNNSIECDKE